MSWPAWPTYGIEMELAGAGNGWTDVSDDLRREEGVSFQYGLPGGKPLDRVADTGWLKLSLDNSEYNSARRLGYYSPLHDDCRTGFGYGIGLRIYFTFGGVTYYKWRGKVKDIDPVPGQYRERVTRILAVDWMVEAAEYAVREVDLQITKRSDQVFSEVLSVIPVQPAASSIAAGIDTWSYALDDAGDHPTAMTLFQKIAQSELGLIYMKGDTTQGGTLVFEDRHARMSSAVNQATFDNDMIALSVPRTLESIYNRVELVYPPTRIDAAATTVLYSLPQPQAASIAPGQTATLWADYRDPNQEAVKVGGTSMVAPVAPPDYTMNTAADGSGTPLTGSFAVVATFFASTVKFAVTDNHATLSGYITKLQCQGKGIYRYAPVTLISEDAASQAAYGLRVLRLEMPYQDNHNIAQGCADYVRSLYSDPIRQADSLRFLANLSTEHIENALALEISDRIGIKEEVSGLTDDAGGGAQRGWFINAIQFDIDGPSDYPTIWCTYKLAPAESQTFWLIGIVGASECDVSTRWGYA